MKELYLLFEELFPMFPNWSISSVETASFYLIYSSSWPELGTCQQRGTGPSGQANCNLAKVKYRF